MDCIERRKDREDFERVGSSTSETPAAFGLTVARTLGVGSSFLASLFPLITALSTYALIRSLTLELFTDSAARFSGTADDW